MKGYRVQTFECIKNGTRFEVPCIRCSQINLICSKYKAYCSGGLCRNERMTDAEKAEFYANRVSGKDICSELTKIPQKTTKREKIIS